MEISEISRNFRPMDMDAVLVKVDDSDIVRLVMRKTYCQVAKSFLLKIVLLEGKAQIASNRISHEWHQLLQMMLVLKKNETW